MFCALARANRIDNLQTDKDVANFFNSFLKKKATRFTVPTTDYIWKNSVPAMQAQVQNWQKADLNGDGHTDLLVNSFLGEFRPFVILYENKRHFKVIELSYSMFDRDDVAKLSEVNNQPVILFYKKMFGEDRMGANADTLVYRFNGFVEYNPQPQHQQIAEINYRTGMCLGECPVFAINIKADGKATYTGGQYNEDFGDFYGQVAERDLKMFNEVIDYLDPKKLNNKYKVDWTDSPTCWLTVKFKDGTIKEIEDYGELGTFGLRRLYSIFAQFKVDQYWYPVAQ